MEMTLGNGWLRSSNVFLSDGESETTKKSKTYEYWTLSCSPCFSRRDSKLRVRWQGGHATSGMFCGAPRFPFVRRWRLFRWIARFPSRYRVRLIRLPQTARPCLLRRRGAWKRFEGNWRQYDGTSRLTALDKAAQPPLPAPFVCPRRVFCLALLLSFTKPQKRFFRGGKLKGQLRGEIWTVVGAFCPSCVQ